MTLDPPLSPVTDADLVARIAAGDRAAFGELFRRRSKDVYRFALHVTGAPSTADDVTQDAFVALMRDASRFEQGRSTVVAWLCGIARNAARQRLDRERPFAPLPGEGGEGEAALPLVIPDPEGELTRVQTVERVRAAVLTLPLHYREVVVLCDLQELSYAEAAVAVGCAVGTVRSRLHRGRELLAAKLAASRGEQPSTRLASRRCLA